MQSMLYISSDFKRAFAIMFSNIIKLDKVFYVNSFGAKIKQFLLHSNSSTMMNEITNKTTFTF